MFFLQPYVAFSPSSRRQISYGFSRFASDNDTLVPKRCDSCTAMIISSAARPSSPLEQARTGRSSSMAWINSRTMIKLL